MARNDAGKWVARAGATGGGRTYRGRTPVNWYSVVALIVVLGVLSVVYSNYEYRRSASSTTTPPAKGTTWYAALSIDVCGTVQAPLPSNQVTTAKSGQSFFTTGTGVITISPQNAANGGTNATLGKFVTGYHGLSLTATELQIPNGKKKPAVYRNGQTCAKGTPDAGKKGEVTAKYWKSAFASKTKGTVVSGDPSTLRFTQNQLITIGFVPAGTKLGKPGGTVVSALINAAEGTSSTTTASTVPTTTASTVPTTTASTVPTTTASTVPTTTASTAKRATSTTAAKSKK
jgi:hypothetical protein